MAYKMKQCGRGIEIGRSVSPPAGRTPAKGASVSSSEGCAGERIGTRYLRPGGTRPLKGASLIVGMYNVYSQSFKRETLKTPRVNEMLRLKHVEDAL